MIIHGEALEELRKLAVDSIDFICTDPPLSTKRHGLIISLWKQDLVQYAASWLLAIKHNSKAPTLSVVASIRKRA